MSQAENVDGFFAERRRGCRLLYTVSPKFDN